MLFFSISALVNAITSISLGIFVYFQNPKKELNRYFGLFAISVALWSTGYFAWQNARDVETAIILIRILMSGAILIPVFYFHFVITLVGLTQKLRIILVVGYLFIFLFVPVTFFTDLLIRGVAWKLWFPFWPQPGVLFHMFLSVFLAYAAYSWYVLIGAIRNAKEPTSKNQLLYVFWGTLIGFLGGSTNYFLWYDIPIPPIGNFAVAIYVAMIALAILKTRLFDIRVFLTQLLVVTISVLLFINLVLSQTMFEYFWKGSILLAFTAAGYLLIKSVLNEIKIREELQGAYEQLARLDRAKSEFLSIASHQLRAPLTAVKGYLSLLLEGTYGSVSDKQKKPLASMYESNERLIRLVNDLLNLSRIESGRIEMNWQQSNIEKVTRNVLEELKIKAEEKGLALNFEKQEAQIPPIRMDADKIRNAILNLVDNAIKYTQTGNITVKLKIVSLGEIPQKGKNSKLKIEITDTGEGMTKEEMQKLFESFSRGVAGSKLWTEGAGLGLYIAKRFVQLHGGKIWAESEGKGRGSTFFIELPLQ
ncbi:MAG: hypothetical protein HYS52_01890 [Candidatus Wildermuthbacteria bacterium]|nr:hypothetical protein [Candidatus Wildermuthbacteria bacterium]